MRQVGVLGLVSHVIFLVLFAVMGLRLLVVVNVASIVCYIVILWATGRRSSSWVITLTSTELLTHAVVAVWVLGWDAQFQYYVLLFIPLALQAEGTRARKLTSAGVTGAGFLAMTALLGGAPGIAVVDSHLVVTLRLLNATIYLLMLCHLSLVYVRTVEDAEEQLRRAAERDSLTGLLNRSSLLDRGARSLRPREGVDRAASTWVVFVDIDHFKNVNDRFGHAAGDRVIRQVAQRIQQLVGHRGLVARWGGEEFLVLLLDAGERAALDTCELLRASMADPRSEHPALREITVTVGIAHHAPGAAIEATIGRADGALYRGKRAGRDRVELAAAAAGLSATPHRQPLAPRPEWGDADECAVSLR